MTYSERLASMAEIGNGPCVPGHHDRKYCSCGTTLICGLCDPGRGYTCTCCGSPTCPQCRGLLCKSCGSTKRTSGYCERCNTRTETAVVCHYPDTNGEEAGCCDVYGRALDHDIQSKKRADLLHGGLCVANDDCPF